MTLVKFNRDQKNKIVNPFFNDVYSILNDSFLNEKLASRTPAVNIAENDNQFEVELAVPGLSKEDIKINLDKNVLSVSADKKTETTGETKNIPNANTVLVHFQGHLPYLKVQTNQK
jgi:HSP20 family protein